MESHFILYVADQARSRDFYGSILGIQARLDVPGMTEFQLAPGAVLGLMPEAGIRKLLEFAPGAQGSRCELYCVLENAEAAVERALGAGARMLSALAPRDWGDRVAYFLDPDDHVLALAGRVEHLTSAEPP